MKQPQPLANPSAVVAGHICLDVIPDLSLVIGGLASPWVPGALVEVGPVTVTTGGVVSNTGLALHRLGTPVRLVGKVGSDAFGQTVLRLLGQHDPRLAEDMIAAVDENTSYTVVLSPANTDRTFLHCPGANHTFSPADIPWHRIADAALFHFGYPPLMQGMYRENGIACADLFSRARRLKLTTSLDMAMPDAAAESGQVDWPELLRRVLPQVDLFAPSVEEMLFMLDRPRYRALVAGAQNRDPIAGVDGGLLGDLAVKLLDWGAAVVALKLGSHGLYLRTSNDPARIEAMGRCAPRAPALWCDRELLAPCFEVTVVGTTGSGDCTVAGLLAALLRGLPPEDVVKTAVAVGAHNVEQVDAVSGIPSWDRVQQRIRSGWRQRPLDLDLEGWAPDPEQHLWRAPREQR